MDLKKVSWYIGSASLLGFVIMLIIPFFYTEESDSKKTKKVIEVLNSSLVGYEDGKKNWVIDVKYMWAGKSKYLFRAEKVLNGKLFDDNGKVVMDQLKARKIKLNSKSKSIIVRGGVSASFIKREKVPTKNKEKKTPTHNIKISSDILRYFNVTKRSYLEGNVVVNLKDAILYSRGDIAMNHRTNIAELKNSFKMESNEFIVTGNHMRIVVDEDFAEATNDIVLLRKLDAKPDSEFDEREISLRGNQAKVTCDYFKYYLRKKKDLMEIKGNIRVIQKDKFITAQYGYYNREKGIFYLQDNVVLKTSNLKWLLTNGQIENFKNELLTKDIKRLTQISCYKMSFDSNKKIVECIGDVVIKQKDKVIKCNKLVFYDKKQKIILSGNIEINKKGEEKITCSRLVADLKNETIEANRNISTEFFIDIK